jgi:hypothetical protein
MSARALDPATGSEVWARTYKPASVGAVTVGPAGEVFFAGHTTGADFGGGKVAGSLPSGEAFVASLDAGGAYRYALALPFDTHQSAATAVALDLAGQAGVTGSYIHYVDSGNVVQSAFFAAVGPKGESLAQKTFGPSDGYGSGVTQEGWGLAPAPAGGFYLGGDFYTAIDVGGTSLSGDGSADVFVAKVVF